MSYKVHIVDQEGFNIRPKSKKQQIIISKSANLTFFSIEGEVKHEITHILRFENGHYNNIKREQNYLPTEEGLASYCQDYFSKKGKRSLFQHSAEYIATQVGLTGSLRDIYNYFLSICFSKELAWSRSIRHKFGFKNTKEKGDIIKPAMYFFHEEKIRKLEKDNFWKLFVGKISMQNIPNFHKYTGKFPLEKIQCFYKSII